MILDPAVPKLTEHIHYPSDSGEEDDDDDDAVFPEAFHRIPILSVSHEEECEEAYEAGLTGDKQALLKQSYAKLMAKAKPHYSSSLHSGSIDEEHKDKWHDWIKMQKDWMNNLDKDGYFDDGL